MPNGLHLSFVLLGVIAGAAQANQLNFNVVLQHGSPVLRRDTLSIGSEYPTAADARKMAQACIDELQRLGIRGPGVRSALYQISTSLQFPQGLIGEHIIVEVAMPAPRSVRQ